MLKHAFATIEKSAVGNHGIAINNAMADNGFDVPMFSETIRPEFRDTVSNFETFKNTLKDDDVVFYQFANPSPMADLLYERKCKLILNYHCITPAYFFERYDLHTCEAISRARTQLARLAPICSAAVAVSDFNASELIELGYKNVEVIPPVFSDVFYKAPMLDQSENDKQTKWLFVGRIAPHKSIHKIIEAFDFYIRNVDKNAKLTIVGKCDVELYGKKINQLIQKRNLSKSVEIRNDCSQKELASLYFDSSVFVSLSEHEGFGVPIVEAMASGLPVVALRAGAVEETVSGAGILLDSSDAIIVAAAVKELVANDVLRDEVINKGLVRAQIYHPENTLKSYVDYLSGWV
jgi:glycosyltransferase involved in cell wall biosynthesis